jgi:hypothetical protein
MIILIDTDVLIDVVLNMGPFSMFSFIILGGAESAFIEMKRLLTAKCMENETKFVCESAFGGVR